MPTYDYECSGCGHVFEVFQSIHADRLKDCPQCREPLLRRLPGAGSAIVFKGSGFYQTDYRSEKYKQAASQEKSAGSSESASSDGKTDSGKTGDSGKKGEGNTGGAKAGDAAKPGAGSTANKPAGGGDAKPAT